MKKKTVLTLLVIILLLIAIAGISFAAFLYAKNGANENSIELGDITFKYTENNTKGNGINIEEGFPISDSEGKVLDKYFDFKVESNLSHSDLLYEVSIEPTEESTINLDGVKVYITELDNDTEKDINSNYDINDKVKVIGNYSNGIIYQERILKNTRNYEKHFRVRIWVSEDIDWTDEGYIGEIGSFRINVNARSNQSMVDASVPVPVITGGAGDEWISSDRMISVVESTPYIGGIDHYEYYVTNDENDIPTDTTLATGITYNEVLVDGGGANYIYYRTVAQDGKKSLWSNSQIVKINDSDEKWEKLIRAASYRWYNYSSLEDAMSDTEITNNIFNNSDAMTYLVANNDLLMEIKDLDNYHSTIAPKMLASPLYTDYEKYGYGLPFYLYNQGTYDSRLFNFEGRKISRLDMTNTTRGTLNYVNRGSYVEFTSTNPLPYCVVTYGESNIPLVINKYKNAMINITSYSNSSTNYFPGFGFLTVLNTSQDFPPYGSSINSTGITTLEISTDPGSGNYYPTIYYHGCTQGGNITTTIYYNKFWLE